MNSDYLSTLKNPSQAVTIDRLERAGFRFSNWFSACDPENESAQCALLKRRDSKCRSLTICAEVDPDGTVNGKTVDAYLLANPR